MSIVKYFLLRRSGRTFAKRSRATTSASLLIRFVEKCLNVLILLWVRFGMSYF